MSDDDVRCVCMTWWSDECGPSWMNVTRRCTMMSVEVGHGRRQKRDIVKRGKTMRDIVNVSFQNA